MVYSVKSVKEIKDSSGKSLNPRLYVNNLLHKEMIDVGGVQLAKTASVRLVNEVSLEVDSKIDFTNVNHAIVEKESVYKDGDTGEQKSFTAKYLILK